MPRKAKTTDQEQEILGTGMEQQEAEETPTEGIEGEYGGQPDPEENPADEMGGEYAVDPNPEETPEGEMNGEYAGLPEPEENQEAVAGDDYSGAQEEMNPEASAGESFNWVEPEDGRQEDEGEFTASGDEPDPALDPSLVIPTLPLPEEQPVDTESESPPEPEPQKPARKRAIAASPAADSPAPAIPAKRVDSAGARKERKETSAASKRVVTIGDEANIQSADEKEAYLWMELRNSLRGKRILTGILGGVERSANGLCTAVVYYKDQRIVIPASEMFLNIGADVKNDLKALYNRQAQVLTRSLGAEMDFIISGIDRRSESVVASRKEAMIRKQQNFFMPTIRNKTPLISEGQVVEARVISVGDKNMRVEAFGVESTILAREVAWEWVDDCTEYYRIGDRVLVKILRIDTRDPQNIRISASIREAAPNPARENIKKCTVQGKYIGKVTGVDKRAIYVRLNVGVNALAIAVHDRKIPCRKDDVSFVITRIDKEAGIAIGIITKVIKQFV